MITGDSKDTALAIARETGLIKNTDDIALTSDRMHMMSDKEISDILPACAS